LISQRAEKEALFPLSDQLPLGRLAGGGDPVPLRSGGVHGSDGITTGDDPIPFRDLPRPRQPAEPVPGATRPFGLRYAIAPTPSDSALTLDLDRIRYDEVGQIALAWDDTAWVPLVEHSMGLTLHTTGQIPREDEIHDKT
jgi:hypothetical protein